MFKRIYRWRVLFNGKSIAVKIICMLAVKVQCLAIKHQSGSAIPTGAENNNKELKKQ